MSATLAPATLLLHRYRIIGAAGQGTFGQTYLARDLQQTHQLCVLKEFMPTATDPETIETLRQQFQQAVAPLYALQHPQLPQLHTMIAEGQRLYWVREYIEGKSYGILLDERNAAKANDRTSKSQVFSEAEVVQLLAQVLPVLTYLHDRGIVHRNISPNTIILRQRDQLPVLISYGLVKELVAHLQLHPVLPQDVLGDWGYVSPEQAAANTLYPNSDLFALAVTTIVLLTGRRPEELYDEQTQAFRWESRANITPPFTQFLRQMLHPDPTLRFASAAQAWKALELLIGSPLADAASPTLEPTQLQPTETHPPAQTVSPSHPPVKSIKQKRQPPKTGADPRASAALLSGVALLIAVISWKVLSSARTDRPEQTAAPVISPSVVVASPSPSATSPPPTAIPTASPSASPTVSPAQEALRERRRQLGIDFPFFTNLVDEVFYTQYPDLKDRKLGGDGEQEALRTEWNTIASSLMDQLETLKPETRLKLGTYRRANYDEWLAQLGEATAPTSPVLDPLADDRFYQLLPEQKGKPLNPKTFGQIWYAIAEEQLEAAKAKKAATPPP